MSDTTTKTKAFQAYADGARVTAETPRAAAVKFFATFPNRRKCNVTEGEVDGAFFTVRLSLVANGGSRLWKDVRKSQAPTLPAE